MSGQKKLQVETNQHLVPESINPYARVLHSTYCTSELTAERSSPGQLLNLTTINDLQTFSALAGSDIKRG